MEPAASATPQPKAVIRPAIDRSLRILLEHGGGKRGKTAVPEIPAELGKPSNVYGTLACAHVGGVIVLLLASAPALAARRPAWLLVTAPLLGSYVHKLSIILHDCSHYSLFASRRANRSVGSVAAALLGTTFDGFRVRHAEHHRRNGDLEDPEGRIYVELSDASPARLVWQLLNPLVGGPVLESVFGKARARDGRPATVTAEASGSLMDRLVPVVVAQAAIALLATRLGTRPGYALLYPAVTATFGVFFNRLRGFCEHLPPPDWCHGAFVRTHLPNPVDSLLFYGVGMNWHLEHHLFPTVPSNKLPQVHAILERDGFLGPEMTSKSVVGTVFRQLMKRARRSNGHGAASNA